MKNLINSTAEEYKNIILKDIPILDLRSEGEFSKASLPNSVNIPILNDEERHLVGIEHKKRGNDAAVALGNRLVSGEKRDKLIEAWKSAIEANPEMILMCFRGGQRSGIAQMWLEEAGYKVKKLENGYKAFRTYLLDVLNPENISLPSLIISGNTGSGKTVLIKKLDMAIDLEELAKHRGSAFGGRIEPQPSQATFENLLAYEVVKKQAGNNAFIAFESESKGIGRVSIPNGFFEYMHNGPYVYLDSTMEERIDFTYQDYVASDLKDYLSKYGEMGEEVWANALREKLQKLKRKLGAERLNHCLEIFDRAVSEKNPLLHKEWIGFLLENYYDPMYEHHRSRWCDKVIKTGNLDEMYTYLNSFHW